MMRVITKIMICPKCKKEYEEMYLTSYSSGFEDAAGDFIKNNKPITHCENCNRKLVPLYLIKYFDEDGNYSPEQKIIDKGFDLFELYSEIFNNMQIFFNCVDNGKVVLSANIDNNDDKFSTSLILTGIDGDKSFKLLTAAIDEYTTGVNDRKNKFMILNLAKTTNSILSNIYDYIFSDSYSLYKDKHKENILKELIDVEHLL